MPLYEYQCQQCGTRTEVLQRFSDPAPAACEQCGGELKRLPSAPAVQFKGAGWYVTDYARKSGAGAKGESKADAGGGEGKPADGGSAGKAEKADKADKAEKAAGSSSTPAASSGSTGGGSSGKSD